MPLGYGVPKSGTRICAEQSAFEPNQAPGDGRTRSDSDARGGHSARNVNMKHNCDHGDGNDEVTSSAELQKSRCRIFQGSRDEHGDHDFVRSQCCFSIAHDELGEGKTASACDRLEFDLRIKREERRYSISRGRCVAQVSGYGAAVLNLDRTYFARSRFERIKTARERSSKHISPGGKSSKSDLLRLEGDAADFAQPRDINDLAGHGTIAESREKIGASG